MLKSISDIDCGGCEMATCTAPGHPNCTITCSNGCYASYVEPNGPCDTGCSGSLRKVDIGERGKVSVSVTDLSVEELVQVFGSSILAEGVNRGKRISFTARSVTLAELARTILTLSNK